ncbi:MAG: glycosyltransferase [Verrucomicrobia bacterium]|nr:glycosyltransferase [Verrucomicrobiota bacterium]
MDRPLRIAFFVGSFPVISETFILRQITGLLDLGHEVEIFADTRAPNDTPAQPEVASHRLLERTTFMDLPPECAPWELPVWPLTGRIWIPGASTSVHNSVRAARALWPLLGCLARKPGLALQTLRWSEYGFQAASLSILYRLAKLLGKRGPYDVLHAHFGPNGNSFRFARELWRAPFVVSFHGYDFTTFPRKQGVGVYEKLFGTADAVTVNSEFTHNRVAQLGCPLSKLKLLPVGLDLAAFPFSERTRRPNEPVRLLTVARLVEIKGHEFALRAVAKVRERHPELRYDIVGEGALRNKLEQLIAELGLRNVVIMHGARDGAFIRDLLREAHLALLGSVSVEGDQEGQGLFMQEAQACGLPVIATQHGALPEGMLPGKSGFLVPERDVVAMAERIEFLVAHPEVWPEMGRAGRAFVGARYDILQLNRQLVELYERVVESFRSNRQ